MQIPVTAIFDIGKTNKKFFLFNKNYKEIYRDYSRFDLIKDEDGYPTDDLLAIQQWLKKKINETLESDKYKVKAINFSTYGASLVHIDHKGQLLTPLYNYTKPFPEKLLSEFYDKYGGQMTIAHETASPSAGMLNSGFQLYWLKHCHPEIYEKLWCSLHFPQYLSYLFTGIPLSEYTSIGCHTSLWHYEKNDYHDWVYQEGIHTKLPPIVTADTSVSMKYRGQSIKIGVGIHDSSSALVPYLKSDSRPFILVSTGTWSISLNPFNHNSTATNNCSDERLNYMQPDGKTVKATRLFLGNEFNLQTEKLCQHFGKDFGYHHNVKFDEKTYQRLMANFTNQFHFESLETNREQPSQNNLSQFTNFEEAFHQLMIELIELQVMSVRKCIRNTSIERIYIDGGFIDNDIYVKLMTLNLHEYKIRTTTSPLGSALGACIVLSRKNIGATFLEENYALKKHAPLILGVGC